MVRINVPSHVHECPDCGEEWRCWNQSCYYEDGTADKERFCRECSEAVAKLVRERAELVKTIGM